MLYRAILSFTIIWASVVESLLLGEQWKRCIPTASENGPCHVCVCTTEGVFHCREVQCSENALVNPRQNKKECEPRYLYRHENIICSCSETGFWLSTNCRNHFHYIRPKNNLIRMSTRTNIECIPNTLYLVDCNVCHCDTKRFIKLSSCTNQVCVNSHKADNCLPGDFLRVDGELCACSDINFYIDRLCIKIDNRMVQKVNKTDVANMIDIGKNWRDINDINDKDTCESDVEYTIDCNKCSCINGILNCTYNICLNDQDNDKALRGGGKIKKNAFYSLPELKGEDDECMPGQKYRFKCNTCTCSSNKEASCTTMVCLEDFVLDLKALGSVKIVPHLK